MGYRPKTKKKFSNFAFPTTYAVDYAKPIYDETISQVTYGNPSYGDTLATVIDAAKESGVTTPAVVTAPISTVTTPASLDSFIASNAYSNRAAYYGEVQSKLTNTTFKIPDPSGSANAFLQNFQEKEAEREKAIVEAARLKAEADAKAKAEADRVAASLQEAKNQADAPSGNKEADLTEKIDVVTPVAKAKTSNAMLYIGVVAIGIVGIMLLRNK
jgi:hypothetical protein